MPARRDRTIAIDARAASRIIKAHPEVATESLVVGASRQDAARYFIGEIKRSGSTPAQLAKQTTGRGGTGTPGARAQQAEIVRLLADA